MPASPPKPPPDAPPKPPPTRPQTRPPLPEGTELAGEVSFPSEVIRPVPPFTFAVPLGWVAVESPSALVVVGTPASEVEDRWTNVALQHERVPPPFDLKIAAVASWAKVKLLSPSAEVKDERVVRSSDIAFYLRGVDYPQLGDMQPASNVHIIFFGPQTAGRLLDVFEFTCISPSDQIESFLPDFMTIVQSFRFT